MRTALLLPALALTVVSCRCGADERVVAVVDGRALTDDDLRVVGNLDQLVEAELFAAMARRTGLAREGAIEARLRRAERDVLSAALLEGELATATSEQALRRAYEERSASLKKTRLSIAHIVIPEGMDGATVLSRLRAGEAFADVARAISADPATAPRGGELPALVDGSVDAAFFAAASKLRKGDRSDVVRTSFARHVLTALDDPQEFTPSFEEARAQLAATLGQEAQDRLRRRMRDEISVERRASASAGETKQ